MNFRDMSLGEKLVVIIIFAIVAIATAALAFYVLVM
jgi:hypothetical protein